jgi:hypothetical protein
VPIQQLFYYRSLKVRPVSCGLCDWYSNSCRRSDTSTWTISPPRRGGAIAGVGSLPRAGLEPPCLQPQRWETLGRHPRWCWNSGMRPLSRSTRTRFQVSRRFFEDWFQFSYLPTHVACDVFESLVQLFIFSFQHLIVFFCRRLSWPR